MDPEQAQIPLPLPFSQKDIDKIIEQNIPSEIAKKLSKKVIVKDLKVTLDPPPMSSDTSKDLVYIEELLNNLIKTTPSVKSKKNTKNKSLPLIVESYPVCKFYSYSSDTSSEYQYANEVQYHTCSHPSCGMLCTYFDCNTACPFYAEDSSTHSNFKFTSNKAEYNFKIISKRINGKSKNFTILDSNNNTLFELNYTQDSLQGITQENINEEISNIISSYLQDLESSECTLSSIKSPEAEKSALTVDSSKNYFKSLISTSS